MATTISALIPSENKIIHIGNTRVYCVQGRYLKQLTTDHSTYNWLMLNGRYVEAEDCNRSEIIRCFGGGAERLFSPEIIELGDISNLIITSDGVHDFVDIDTLEELICSEFDAKKICENVIKCALNNGSCDDMSILVAGGSHNTGRI